jgi:hypothetical protein
MDLRCADFCVADPNFYDSPLRVRSGTAQRTGQRLMADPSRPVIRQGQGGGSGRNYVPNPRLLSACNDSD